MGGPLEMNKSRRSRIPASLSKLTRTMLNRAAIGSNVTVGRNFRAGFGSRVNSLHGLKVGNSVSLGPGSLVEVNGEIGDFVLIARNVQIVGRADHAIDEVGTPIVFSTWIGDRDSREHDTVRIERDVWLGANVVVLGGVRIGEGSVVGAGSVVSADIPPFTIAAGVPARPLRKRFNSAAEEAQHRDALDGVH